MARRSKENPHPEGIKDVAEEELSLHVDGMARLRDLPGWDRYTWDMKKFLIILPVMRQKVRASLVIGRGQTWLSGCNRAYGGVWKRAMEIRLSQGHVAAEVPAFTQDLWAIAILRLEEKLFSENEIVVLKAVELLAKLQGVLGTTSKRKQDGERRTGREQMVEPFEFRPTLKALPSVEPDEADEAVADQSLRSDRAS